MPVPKKKRITPENVVSTSESSSPPLPDQQEFHQHLRILAQSAVRTVIEFVMREELDAVIGAAWGECTPKRKGYRNGSYKRDLMTSSGRIEDMNVPRDREGQFHTQAFERYSRFEPHIAEGLTQMFVAGTSTHKVGEVAQTLMGVAPSASTISRLNQTLTQQSEAWRERRLKELFSATPSPRCLVHKQRNVLNAIPRRERGDVQAELSGIWEQATKQEALIHLAAFQAKYAQRYPEAGLRLLEDEEHLLTFYDFPVSMHRYLQTTNAIESLFSNVRQRTDQIDVFTTETSCLTIVWATMQDIRLHKISL